MLTESYSLSQAWEREYKESFKNRKGTSHLVYMEKLKKLKGLYFSLVLVDFICGADIMLTASGLGELASFLQPDINQALQLFLNILSAVCLTLMMIITFSFLIKDGSMIDRNSRLVKWHREELDNLLSV